LAGLVATLRQEHLRIGLDREIRAAALVERLGRAGVKLSNPDDAADWLAPILCSSARDQQIVRLRLRALQLAGGSSQTHETVLPPSKVPEFKPAPVMRTDPGLLEKARAASWRALIIGVFVVAVLTIALLATPFISVALNFATGTKGGDAAASNASAWLSRVAPGVLVLVCAAVTATLVIWRHRHRFAIAPLPNATVRRRQLEPARSGISLFDEGPLRIALRGLRREREGAGRVINLAQTIEATVRAGGLPQIARGGRPILPRYVVFVDLAGASDQFRLLANALIMRLRGAGVHLDPYIFIGFPSLLHEWGGAPEKAPEPLAGVIARHRGDRLLLVSDGRALYDSVLGLVEPAVHQLQSFEQVALLTPRTRDVWGRRERALYIAGIKVVELTPAGLAALADWLIGPRELEPLAPPAQQRSPDLAERLDEAGAMLLAREPPSQDRANLLADLQAWLGPSGFALLSVLAASPRQGAGITDRVGAHLASLSAADPQRSIFTPPSEVTIGKLVRLPWMRRGRMPDWLRADLSQCVSDELREIASDAWLLFLAGEEPIPGARQLADSSRSELRRLVTTSLRRSDAYPLDATLERVLGVEPSKSNWQSAVSSKEDYLLIGLGVLAALVAWWRADDLLALLAGLAEMFLPFAQEYRFALWIIGTGAVATLLLPRKYSAGISLLALVTATVSAALLGLTSAGGATVALIEASLAGALLRWGRQASIQGVGSPVALRSLLGPGPGLAGLAILPVLILLFTTSGLLLSRVNAANSQHALTLLQSIAFESMFAVCATALCGLATWWAVQNRAMTFGLAARLSACFVAGQALLGGVSGIVTAVLLNFDLPAPIQILGSFVEQAEVRIGAGVLACILSLPIHVVRDRRSILISIGVLAGFDAALSLLFVRPGWWILALLLVVIPVRVIGIMLLCAGGRPGSKEVIKRVIAIAATSKLPIFALLAFEILGPAPVIDLANSGYLITIGLLPEYLLAWPELRVLRPDLFHFVPRTPRRHSKVLQTLRGILGALSPARTPRAAPTEDWSTTVRVVVSLFVLMLAVNAVFMLVYVLVGGPSLFAPNRTRLLIFALSTTLQYFIVVYAALKIKRHWRRISRPQVRPENALVAIFCYLLTLPVAIAISYYARHEFSTAPFLFAAIPGVAGYFIGSYIDRSLAGQPMSWPLSRIQGACQFIVALLIFFFAPPPTGVEYSPLQQFTYAVFYACQAGFAGLLVGSLFQRLYRETRVSERPPQLQTTIGSMARVTQRVVQFAGDGVARMLRDIRGMVLRLQFLSVRLFGAVLGRAVMRFLSGGLGGALAFAYGLVEDSTGAFEPRLLAFHATLAFLAGAFWSSVQTDEEDSILIALQLGFVGSALLQVFQGTSPLQSFPQHVAELIGG